MFNTSRFVTGPFEHTLTYGGDAFRDKVRTVDPLNSGAQFTPGGERLVYGGFIQDQIAFAGLARTDHARCGSIPIS